MNHTKEKIAKQYFISEFKKHFEGTPRVFRAPGRINLIGEHTDYNDGFVLPILLDKYTTIAIAPRADRQFHIWSENMNELVSFSLESLTRNQTWSDYITGVAKILLEENFLLPGANVCIKSDIPIGGGLSSSAAIEVVIANGLLSLVENTMNTSDIALVCQRAENEFVGMRSGIMDQFVIIHGKENHALLLDCRSLEYEHIPLPTDKVRFVVCNTKIKHELGSSAYNDRIVECEEGVHIMQTKYPDINALRDISMQQLSSLNGVLPDVIHKRCYHVVSENDRVLESVSAIKHHQLSLLGELMMSSHRSLRDNYDVSCEELDIMVDIALKIPGVLGARLTGGGFGGCTVNLVELEHVDNFVAKIKDRYEQATGIKPEIYVSNPAGCAHELI